MYELQPTQKGRRMSRRRRMRVGVMFLVVGALLLLGIFAGAALATLNPPTAYVLAADGVTQQTLEQAGILNPATTGGKTGRQWAIVLGKALFWDQQAGSDGNACASCHFHAGADTRLRNQINPGFNDITKGPEGDSAFGSTRSDTGAVLPGNMPSGAPAGANYVLKPGDMPLHQLQDETNRNSPILTTTNDRVSSLGAFDGNFTRVKVLGQRDKCSGADPSVFHAGPYAARQVEPRNTPTTVNAVFFHRNFWDNRANNLFNGVGVFGMREINNDPDKRLIVRNPDGTTKLDYIKVENASLASQAVGPPLSDLEMSCDGRSFPDVGRKLLLTVPLFKQKVSKTDSILGPHVSASGQGLALQHLYSILITRAFDKKYWAAPGRFKIVNGVLVKDPTGYAQMEMNFSMFWGLAIMLYESTLVSDQSEVDNLVAAGRLAVAPAFNPAGQGCSSPTGDVTELLLRGCKIFSRFAPAGGAPPAPADGVRGGNCFVCHNAPGGGAGRPTPPLLSQAAFLAGEPFTLMIEVGKILGGNHRHDQGTMSIGLRPVFTDLINGGTDPYGNPLSFSRQLSNYLANGQNPSYLLDPVLQRAVAGTTPANPLGVPLAPLTLGVDGAAKSPILRNVALTPPYFSWGGYPSLRQALKLYNRGLNRRDITAANAATEHAAGTECTSGDNTGTGSDGNRPYPLTGVANCDSNTTGVIVPLGLSDCEAPVGSAPRTACDTKGQTVASDDLTALGEFLKSLTDARVQCDQAPFDHPELKILNGHTVADTNHDGKANDIVFTLPAVGAAGYAKTSGYCIPNAGDLFAPGMQSRSGGAKVSIP